MRCYQSKPEELFRLDFELSGERFLHDVAEDWRATDHKQTVPEVSRGKDASNLLIIHESHKPLPAFPDGPIH
jgi:hypothetical protein